MSQERPDGVPSNSKLAERTARIEAQVDHVAQTVDRIEEAVDEDTNEIEALAENNAKKIRPMWFAYLLIKWGLPAGATVVGTGAALGMV